MCRMEWRQDVDNWSLCMWLCCELGLCWTRTLWRGGQGMFGGSLETLHLHQVLFCRSSAKQRTKWAPANMFLRIQCVCLKALTPPYPPPPLPGPGSESCLTETGVTVASGVCSSDMSDPWWESWLCLFVMRNTFSVMWKDAGMLLDSYRRHISSGQLLFPVGGTKWNATEARHVSIFFVSSGFFMFCFVLFFLFFYFILNVTYASKVQACGLGTVIFALCSAGFRAVLLKRNLFVHKEPGPLDVSFDW